MLYLKSLEVRIVVADKILISRMQGFKGISIFSYDAHQNNLDWFNPILHAIDYNNKE